MFSIFRLTPARIALAAAVAGLLPLIAALATQFGLGLRPCELCLYQRIPFYFALALGIVAAFAPLVGPVRRVLVALIAVGFLINVGLASYHFGVEQHWWSASCADTGGGGVASPADLRAALTRKPEVPCDEVPFTLFGLSMAGYNVPYSLFLGLAFGFAAARADWWRQDR